MFSLQAAKALVHTKTSSNECFDMNIISVTIALMHFKFENFIHLFMVFSMEGMVSHISVKFMFYAFSSKTTL